MKERHSLRIGEKGNAIEIANDITAVPGYAVMVPRATSVPIVEAEGLISRAINKRTNPGRVAERGSDPEAIGVRIGIPPVHGVVIASADGVIKIDPHANCPVGRRTAASPADRKRRHWC